MEIKKYGAIDIGSNAVRLLVANVIEEKDKETKFRKSSLVRVPIRLGADAFVTGEISENNKNRMVEAMKAFSLLMKVHGVEKYKACATSAMREASNGEQIVEKIFEESGIQIDIIDGAKEAAIISSTDLKHLINSDETYLYVDVGGGSTEFTLFSRGEIVNSKSFKIGTVRLINNTKEKNKKIFLKVQNWIVKNTMEFKRISLIGSGGNINKLFKMSGLELGRPMSYIYLNAQFEFLKSMTYEERISELSLNPDRADVIIPATKIYLSAMKWSGARRIYVPKIGLSDGIVKSLYYNSI
ncbi:exopolyphosphatase/guanosine-5'-triphosphate,3'-diphosphate pyrophosphatase [Tenacibaculum skagerrakense]|uniref:Exopolyphosphatase/guanosine-5'-triphosphate, 3'-diphosphate pyrophosphatase n=1 Tax=Tenacibaculum skagerrakense TaxID=186571 RepID=A0A4R2NXI8_9FLAO|nr:rod shape-determining protein [Tenacibaculum skagerrakense]TCP26762.1 exopolyphosphatase/guanosine-5'-triphosphate,3'-diphosphate pyrophosphatase [Tenacibaculum skagerrakense]